MNNDTSSNSFITDKTRFVTLEYKEVDGWHMFTSPDLYGLLVASADLRKTFEDIGLSIKTIISLNFHETVRVVPMCSFEEFLGNKASIKFLVLESDSYP